MFVGMVMVEPFEIRGNRELVLNVSGFLDVGEEFDLPSSHFTQGAYCRITKIIGQTNGVTRALASLVKGRPINPRRQRGDLEEDLDQEGEREVQRNRARVKKHADSFALGERIDMEAGVARSTVELREVSPVAPQEGQPQDVDLLLKAVLAPTPQASAGVLDGTEQPRILTAEDHMRLMGVKVPEEPQQQYAAGGRRSKYQDKWEMRGDGTYHRKEGQASEVQKEQSQEQPQEEKPKSTRRFGVVLAQAVTK